MRPCANLSLIGITGQKRNGKDTAANILVRELGFTKLAFADPLKRACAEAFGIDLAYFTVDALKDGPCPAYPHMTNRFVLQHVGTELFRSFIDTIWVDTTMRIAAKCGTPVVISDVRFPNECAAIQERGGIVIRVTNPNVMLPHDAHSSETMIPSLPADYDIINDGTIGDLEFRLSSILNRHHFVLKGYHNV